MEVNFPLRSPTNSGLHLGVTLFERRMEQTANVVVREWRTDFSGRARRDSIATYLPSKSFGPEGGRRSERERERESKTEWTYCRSGIAPAHVSARYLRA